VCNICERLDESNTKLIDERDALIAKVDELEKEIKELKSK
jgi:hypothetical protein